MAIISRTLTYAFNTIFEEAMLVVSICGIYSPICQRASLLTRVNAKRVAVFTASPSLASFQLPFGFWLWAPLCLFKMERPMRSFLALNAIS